MMPAEIVANRIINQAIRNGEVGGWDEETMPVFKAHEFIVRAIEQDRKQR